MAHESEVISGNGLGDVVSQFFGRNIVYRERPGFPPYGVIRIFEISSDDIYSKPLEALPTKSILQPLDVSFTLINEFLSNPSIDKFLRYPGNLPRLWDLRAHFLTPSERRD